MSSFVWFVLGLVAGVLICTDIPVWAQEPVRSGQPHPDIFECGAGCNLQDHNNLTKLAKARQQIRYRLLTMPGCNAGSVPQDMRDVEAEFARVGANVVRNDGNYHFTVRINCGSTHIAICGSINIFCLGRGYPTNPDVDISDIISQWPYLTRVSILMHEVLGHAIGTWNEQYCGGYEGSGPCRGLARFSSTPNWLDIMNTGPNSRHLLGDIELERWERTMYRLEQVPPVECVAVGFDPCTGRWYFADRFSYDPATGVWWNPQGQPEWDPCNQDGLRWNHIIQGFLPQGNGFFLPSRGYWSFAPGC